jgi:hypothetical protein
MKHQSLFHIIAFLTIGVLQTNAQLAAPAGNATAKIGIATAKIDKATEFIRVDRDNKNVRLQTSVTSYIKDGISVDLIGAIHIADAEYYTQLNKEFKNYDALLFEMIGGDKINAGKAKDTKTKPKDPMIAMLGNVYGMVSKLLKLQSQKDGIDYTAKNFVHADLSLQEFERLQTEKSESLLGFVIQNQANAQKNGTAVKQPDMQKLLTAVLSGNANGIKLELVDTLGGAADQMAGMMGKSVIIGDRNKACLKVLNQQVGAGKKKIGISYGARHFPDMEKDMLKMGYKKTGHRWLTAWDIPLAVAQP